MATSMSKRWLLPFLGAAFLSAAAIGVGISMASDVPGLSTGDTGQNPPAEAGRPTATPVPGRNDTAAKRVLAPIDSVEIVTLRSLPPQYQAHIVSGLPNGCATFDGVTQKREGDTVIIEVFNLMPAGDDVFCTMVYGTKESTVKLEGSFDAGKTYAVLVNGEKTTFTAQ